MWCVGKLSRRIRSQRYRGGLCIDEFLYQGRVLLREIVNLILLYLLSSGNVFKLCNKQAFACFRHNSTLDPFADACFVQLNKIWLLPYCLILSLLCPFVCCFKQVIVCSTRICFWLLFFLWGIKICTCWWMLLMLWIYYWILRFWVRPVQFIWENFNLATQKITRRVAWYIAVLPAQRFLSWRSNWNRDYTWFFAFVDILWGLPCFLILNLF